MEQPQYPGKVEQEWLMAILAVTNDAMVIESVRDRQIAIAAIAHADEHMLMTIPHRSENGSGLV